MSKKMIWSTGLSLLAGLACFGVSGMAESSIDADGLLHEPFFFLIPTGWFFIFIGLVTGAMTASASLLNAMRAR